MKKLLKYLLSLFPIDEIDLTTNEKRWIKLCKGYLL